MCASCGCGSPNESHGDASNITLGQVQRAASSAGISPEDAANNIAQAVQSA
jgi:hypothetical protein